MISLIEYILQKKKKKKKTEDLNLSVFNVIKRNHEMKPFTKHISYKCKDKFNGRKCYSNQNSNNDK